MYYHHWFIKGLKKIVTIENLVDSASRESFFDYEYLPEFAAKIRTAQKVV